MHRDELQRLLRLEREPAGEHPEEDHAERVHVARRAGGLARGLLGRDVRRGPHHRSRLGERSGAAHARDPEVGDLGPAVVVEEHVRRLQVAMDEPAVVRVREPGRDAARDLLGLGVGQRRALAEPVLERSARQVLEHHERPAGDLAVVEELVHVRMRERRRCAGLALEARRIGVAAEQLQSDAAAELEILGEEDLGHRSVAEPLDDAVPARDEALAHGSTLCAGDGRVTVDRRGTRARARARPAPARRGRAARGRRGPRARRARRIGRRPAALPELRDGRLRAPLGGRPRTAADRRADSSRPPRPGAAGARDGDGDRDGRSRPRGRGCRRADRARARG